MNKKRTAEQRNATNTCEKYLCTKDQCSLLRNMGIRMRTLLVNRTAYVTGITQLSLTVGGVVSACPCRYWQVLTSSCIVCVDNIAQTFWLLTYANFAITCTAKENRL
jgi:hypothetical protein